MVFGCDGVENVDSVGVDVGEECPVPDPLIVSEDTGLWPTYDGGEGPGPDPLLPRDTGLWPTVDGVECPGPDPPLTGDTGLWPTGEGGECPGPDPPV